MQRIQVTGIATIVLSTMLSTVGWTQVTCSQTPTNIRIAANRLDKALIELTSQTNCPIKWDRKLVQPFRSAAVKGNLTPADALIQLVKGTGLEAHMGENLTVNRADQETIGLKAATLQADLGQAVKAQQIPQHTANQMYKTLSDVRTSVVDLAKKQGFVSAAEKASYRRTFNEAEQLLIVSKTKR